MLLLDRCQCGERNNELFNSYRIYFIMPSRIMKKIPK